MDNRIRNLCKRSNNADKDAVCELLKIYYTDIYAYLKRLCGSRADAEDLTQQTFLKVWAPINDFSGYSKFLTWIYRIAHNTYIEGMRFSLYKVSYTLSNGQVITVSEIKAGSIPN